MKILTVLSLLFCDIYLQPVTGFTSLVTIKTKQWNRSHLGHNALSNDFFEPPSTTGSMDLDGLKYPSSSFSFANNQASLQSWTPVLAALPIVLTALPAAAAGGGVIPSALAAYGHYLGLLVGIGCLVYERITIEPGMSLEKEKSVVIADAVYLLSFASVMVTGYYRATEYGKGIDFYVHEPYFWLKMAFVAIQGGLEAFPAITYIKRAGGLFGSSKIEPLSEKLSGRLHKVLNAEISAVLFTPLAATVMARGVSYSQDFPWQAGLALTGVALLGSSALYAKQALTWTEEDVPVAVED